MFEILKKKSLLFSPKESTKQSSLRTYYIFLRDPLNHAVPLNSYNIPKVSKVPFLKTLTKYTFYFKLTYLGSDIPFLDTDLAAIRRELFILIKKHHANLDRNTSKINIEEFLFLVQLTDQQNSKIGQHNYLLN